MSQQILWGTSVHVPDRSVSQNPHVRFFGAFEGTCSGDENLLRQVLIRALMDALHDYQGPTLKLLDTAYAGELAAAMQARAQPGLAQIGAQGRIVVSGVSVDDATLDALKKAANVCARCGTPGAGKFCQNCGNSLLGRF